MTDHLLVANPEPAVVNACSPDPDHYRAASILRDAGEVLDVAHSRIDIHVRELFGPALADALLPELDRAQAGLEMGLDLFRRAAADLLLQIEVQQDRHRDTEQRDANRIAELDGALEAAALEAVARARRGRRALPGWAADYVRYRMKHEAPPRELGAPMVRWFDDVLPEADRNYLLECSRAQVMFARAGGGR